MKKRIICFILTISLIMSAVITVSASEQEAEEWYNSNVLVLEGLGLLDEELLSLEKTELVTRGQFEKAIAKIKNTQCTDYKKEYISVIDAINIAAYEFGYEFFIGMENTEYVSYKRQLLRGISLKGTDVLTVESCIKMLYNIIKTPVMERTIYGHISTFEVDEKKTPLTEYHKIYFKKGRVTANSLVSIDKYGITDPNYIRVGGNLYFDAKNYSDYIGHYVEFYYQEDRETSLNTVLYMSKTYEKDVVTLSAYDIKSFNDLTYTYYENDTQKEIEIQPVHTVILNGEKLDIYEIDVYTPEKGTVTLIPNNEGKYDVVIIESFESFPLLSATAGGTDEIIFTERYTNRIFTLDTNDTDYEFNLYIDGKPVALEKFKWEHLGEEYETINLPEIPKYSVANIFADKYTQGDDFTVPSKDAKYVRVDITTKIVEGFAEQISGDGESIVISGQKYPVAKKNSLDRGISYPKLGEKGIFMLDCDNRITAWARDYKDNRILSYAYLINAAPEKGLDGKLKAKLLLPSGDIEILDIKEKVLLNSSPEKEPKKVYDDLKASAKLLDPTFNISQLIKFRTDEEGRICEIQTVLQNVGLPSGADPSHLQRVAARDKYYSRSDNGYSLYKYVGSWPYTAYYLKPDIIFSVPPTETFKDEDYNINYNWLPDYSGKVSDIFDVDDYLKPQAVVTYETETNSIYRPYVMVDEITTELDSNQNIVTVLRCYDGYDSMAFYSDDESLFAGLKEGDLVYLYGSGNKITKRPQLIADIDDIKKFDYTTIPKKTTESNVDLDSYLYQLYAYEGRSLTLQRGNIDSLSKRTFQKGAYWTTNVGSLHYGAIFYDAEARKGKRISSAPDTSVMRPAITHGDKDASKMFVYETGGICRLVVIYNGL